MHFLFEMWSLAIEGEEKGIWFFCALYTFIVCSYSLFFQIRTRFWPYSYGVLAHTSVKKFGGPEWVRSEQNYTADALYHYCVDGKNYEGKRVSPWVMSASHNARFILKKQLNSIETNQNGEVKVFYNPKNPRKSFLIIANKPGIAITFAISLVPFIAYAIKFYG